MSDRDPAYWRQRAQQAIQAARTVRPESKPFILEIADGHEARARHLEQLAVGGDPHQPHAERGMDQVVPVA